MPDLPDVERSIVYTPQPGDVVVLEVPGPITSEQADRLKTVAAAKVFGHEVQIVVLNMAHFAGVVRPDRTDG